MIRKVKALLITLHALLAVIPGIGVFWKGYWAPPGQKATFGIVLEVFGVLALLLLLVNRSKIMRFSMARVTKWSIFLGCLTLVLFLAYLVLFEICVVTSTRQIYADFGPVYFPLFLTGQLEEKVDEFGSRQAVLNKYGPAAISNEIAEMPSFSFYRSTTTVVLVVVYASLMTSLSLSFGLPGFYVKPKNG